MKNASQSGKNSKFKPKNYQKKRQPHSKYKAPKIKPGKDALLKKVFASIGTPENKPFKPDPFQLNALEAIKDDDCLVSVPTGSGKTWIAEKAIDRIHSNNGKSWYASPLKALTNSKYIEFSERFGDKNVGILTGDRKEKLDASIIVGTTEILRNQLYDAMYRGEDLGTDLVILDEAHFLGDEDRGVVWEEIMIYLPVRIPLLMLSATIGNAHQIAHWLSLIRSKKCIVIEEKIRPVPLFPLFFHPSGTLFPLIDSQNAGSKTKVYRKVGNYLKKPRFLGSPYKLPPLGEVMMVLEKYNLLPAIFFLKSRMDCNGALELCMEPQNEDPERFEKRNRYIDKLIIKYPHIANHKQLWHLKYLAVGAHHSGQLPAWKLVIEALMTEGLLNTVFATSTVAAGVNFPARTIVLLNSDRFNGTEFVTLNSTEFHQMTGRAGRRGSDNIGFAVVIPGKFMNIKQIATLYHSPPAPVLSQIKINFSMALNLLLSHSPDQIKNLLERSFATYLIVREKRLSHKRRKAARIKLWKDFVRHLNFLKKEGFANEDNTLTDDGIWTSQLRVDQPLLIAEGFRQDVFPEKDPALLAALIATFVSDRETEYLIDEKFLNVDLISYYENMIKALSPMAKRMIALSFETKPLFFQPAVIIYAWASGESWENVLKIANTAEGDLAMLILRTADNLRHTEVLKKIFPTVAETSRRAIDLILREPVVMDISSEFRVAPQPTNLHHDD
ncbi:RNA helicase of the superfamily II [Candidatus Magnetomoraceae bacterium gMMP-15]